MERDPENLRDRYREALGAGHGRIGERSYYLAKAPRDFAAARDCPWVEVIGDSVRITRQADGTGSGEVRSYLGAVAI